MRRKTGIRMGVVAGIAATIGMTVAAAPTAVAGSSGAAGASSTCTFTKTLCLYDGTNYTGSRLTVSSLVPGGTCVSLVDHGWGGRVRSVVNTHTSSAAMFMNDDCVGGPYQVPGGSGIPDLGGFSPASVWVAG